MRTWTWDVGEGNASVKGQQNTLMTDLFHTAADDPATGDHHWALFLTDILDGKGEWMRWNEEKGGKGGGVER